MMRDTLQMTDPLSLALGRKVEKHEQTAAEEAAELLDLSRLVFEKLPHNLNGQPMLGSLRPASPIRCDFIVL